MFEVSRRAAAALARSRTKKGLAKTIAIRISASESGNGSSPGYQLRFASNPAQGDVVLDSADTKVFLSPELVEPLERTVLDAVETPHGEQLVLKHRSPE